MKLDIGVNHESPNLFVVVITVMVSLAGLVALKFHFVFDSYHLPPSDFQFKTKRLIRRPFSAVFV